MNYLGTNPVQQCYHKLGMENGDIADGQLSSTKPWAKGKDDCSKQYSRLELETSATTCDAFAPLTRTDQGIYYFELIYMSFLQV